MTDLYTLGLAQIILGLVIAALCIPLIRGRVPRNRFYGFRFPQSLESDANWFAINRFGGRRLFIWSIVFVILGAAILMNLIAPQSIFIWAGLSVPVILFIPIIQTYIYGRSLSDKDI
ncbi:MAG: SdpI family protein [Candidatus Eisenbacteria bacterium]|uniref:SdpI family protein n=1 Tax=Eiseniibacteriota bacterium TaxID=2212470 RepID=A0A948S0T2_UNCEI|nr:SdpI family protein [Candidatus Eisenbacteria bacterium]MBU1950634.1 SdpI family protein [Candidatus Eisenbacteria bacterium]MBU2691744.1 SdpI family protein [Candidatus Eisenbacteria bacterium]